MENNNLNTFRILYLVKGILTLIFSLFFAAYAMFGYFFEDLMDQASNDDVPFNPGIIFLTIGVVGFVLAWILGIVTIMAAKHLKNRTGYTFIFVVAILNCLTGVLGILLGVFSILELNKPEVKALFDKNKELR